MKKKLKASGVGGKRVTVGKGLGNRRLSARMVSESDRINIAARLEHFRASDSNEMSFETDLSNDDKAMVHDLCKKMGLKSKSHGKGNQRYVTVSKVVKQHLKDESSLTTLSFSTATQEVLIEHFTHFPPTNEEVVSKGTVSSGASIQRISTPGTAPGGKGNVQNGGGPRTSSTGVSDNGTIQAAILAAQLQKMPGLQQIADQRAKLPIVAYKDVITVAVDKNQLRLRSTSLSTVEPSLTLDDCKQTQFLEQIQGSQGGGRASVA